MKEIKQLTVKRKREIQHMICEMFKLRAYDSIIDITDVIEFTLQECYGLTLDYLDTVKDLQRTYQTLAHNHKLYKDGATTLKWFTRICEEEKI